MRFERSFRLVGSALSRSHKFSGCCNLSRRLCSNIKMQVSVDKDPTLADEAFQLKISGLKPNQRITLHSSLRLPRSSVFESLANYVADEDGVISLYRHPSHGGSFVDVQPMGPINFMEPSPLNERKYERFLVKDPTKPFKIEFRILQDFISSLQDPLAQDRFKMAPNFTISRTYMAPGVKEIPVTDGRVRATLYLPEGRGPFPGIVSMSGGYPGAMKHKAAILASHGFAALALKYFGEDDLSDDFFNVDLDYIEEAVRYMINHKMIHGERGVGIVANCYGGTIALTAASVFPKGLIRCIATTSSWPFPGGNFQYKGKLVKPEMCAEWVGNTLPNGIGTFKINIRNDDDGLITAEESAPSFYKQHDIPFLHILGEDDGYLQSSRLAPILENLYKRWKHPNYEIHLYKGAGHLVEHSFYPFTSIVRTFDQPHDCGGKQPGHAIAQNDSWPKILEFVRKNLVYVKSKL